MRTDILKRALKASQYSDHKWAFHGAIALRGGAIQGIGYNHGTTHAEVKALQAIWPNKRKGLTLWCVRLTRSGLLSMSKPCAACTKFLKENGIKTVYYTSSDGNVTKERI